MLGLGLGQSWDLRALKLHSAGAVNGNAGYLRFNKQLTQKKKFDTGARRLTLSRECLRVRVDLGAA